MTDRCPAPQPSSRPARARVCEGRSSSGSLSCSRWRGAAGPSPMAASMRSFGLTPSTPSRSRKTQNRMVSVVSRCKPSITSSRCCCCLANGRAARSLDGRSISRNTMLPRKYAELAALVLGVLRSDQVLQKLGGFVLLPHKGALKGWRLETMETGEKLAQRHSLGVKRRRHLRRSFRSGYERPATPRRSLRAQINSLMQPSN